MASVPSDKRPAESKIIVEFTEDSARAILQEILMLKGATAVEWKLYTPKLTALENTFVAMLHQGRVA